MIHIRYHGVLLWNEIIVDWLGVGTWFGTFHSHSARMWACGLVRPLFVVQTTWFGIPNVCDAKESGWNMVSKTMKYVTAMTYRWALGWWRHPCFVLSYFYQRVCGCWEVWVGWDRVVY